MTRQAWTALVAAVAFVLTAATVLLSPVPYVAWAPGTTADTLGQVDGKPLITVAGTPSYPTTGRLDLTTVLQTSAGGRLSLPEALWAHLAAHRDVLPRQTVYPAGTTAAESEQQETQAMRTAQDTAVVAALRTAGRPVRASVVVGSVGVDGPAHGRLEPGDVVRGVDAVSVPVGVQAAQDDRLVERVQTAVRSRPVGSTLTFRVSRAGKPVQVRLVSVEKVVDGERVPAVGIDVALSYAYGAKISYALGDRIGGPSAGLAFGVAIYDKITAGPLLDGRHVAGTGTIDAQGDVGPIGGIQEKIAGAEKVGATVFLVPAGNCADLAGVHTDLNLIRAATLSGAVQSLRDLDAGGARASGVPRC